MEGVKKGNLINIIYKSAEELHQKIDMHRYLMATIIDKNVSEKKLNHVPLPDSHREFRLKKAIKETIEILEETREAFKSKRLEALRKKLTGVLIEF